MYMNDAVWTTSFITQMTHYARHIRLSICYSEMA